MKMITKANVARIGPVEVKWGYVYFPNIGWLQQLAIQSFLSVEKLVEYYNRGERNVWIMIMTLKAKRAKIGPVEV